MNYRHSFHAGNFADVLKHSVLALVITYLQRKEAALFVLDTHAGRAVYDLAGRDAQKTGEWREGVGRIQTPGPGTDADIILQPYRALLAGFNKGGDLRTYPGSSAILRVLLRPHDRAIFCEAHRDEAARLRQHCAGDSRVRVIEGDGYGELSRCLPPPERRGLILIDPPYEATNEYSILTAALEKALRRFANGVYLVWYPVTALRASLDGFLAAIRDLNLPKTLRIELTLRPSGAGGLTGCGLLVINQPHLLETQMQTLLPFLASTLAGDHQGSFYLGPLG